MRPLAWVGGGANGSGGTIWVPIYRLQYMIHNNHQGGGDITNQSTINRPKNLLVLSERDGGGLKRSIQRKNVPLYMPLWYPGWPGINLNKSQFWVIQQLEKYKLSLSYR